MGRDDKDAPYPVEMLNLDHNLDGIHHKKTIKSRQLLSTQVCMLKGKDTKINTSGEGKKSKNILHFTSGDTVSC